MSISKPELPSNCLPDQFSKDWNLNQTSVSDKDTTNWQPNEDDTIIELGEADMILSDHENQSNHSEKIDLNNSPLELSHFSPKENLIVTIDATQLEHLVQQSTNLQRLVFPEGLVDQNEKSTSANQNSSVRRRKRRGGKKKFKPLKNACAFCNEMHLGYRCRRFLDLSITERCAFIQTKSLCLLCFKPMHAISNYGSCNKCNGAHHSVLHQDDVADEDQMRDLLRQTAPTNRSSRQIELSPREL